MADPKKFKSVFLPIKPQNFRFLGNGKLIDSNFTISKTIEVLLKYDSFGNPVIKQINRISKPGRRFYSNIKSLWNLNAGLGIFIITTPKGIMTHLDAKILNYGGEIICSIY